MNPARPDLASITAAGEVISGHVARTRLITSRALSAHTGAAEVYLKLEIDQPTGSFKVRGACNAIRRLQSTRPDVNGVTTASTGNHARAVAYMASRFGLTARAYLARTVPPPRAQALRDLGATVDHNSQDQDQAVAAAQAHAASHRLGFIPPFDHPDVISGQGTIGLELLEAQPDLDVAIIQVSGGGLIAGIGLALKALHPSTQVIGVCAQNADAMRASLIAGHPVTTPETPTVATSLMGGIGPHNQYTFPIARTVIDEMVTVTDDQLTAATDALHTDDRLTVEPAAAAGAAYLRTAGARFRDAKVALILTGNAI